MRIRHIEKHSLKAQTSSKSEHFRGFRVEKKHECLNLTTISYQEEAWLV